ncbi:hypothetical protein CHARACLAT_017026 [Characodon lateralis]|uniref:Protein kinase domain-containing protein n=1 Tax=Characodon lateralis TaxID=208331 RepID=A0ABU7F3P3_9TELE|nr:hypothetical protein [Characodon lateralis]
MGNKCGTPSPDPSVEALNPLPHRYEILKYLGEGGSAVVLKCLDRRTHKNVAVKFAKRKNKLNHEAAMMNFLMKYNLDQHNIIKFHHSSSSNSCLVFDMCDITLHDYFKKRKTPMDLQDIGTVIQQLAVALHALKNFGIIHCDLKTNNIMVVNQKRKPLEVKLIDFGLALFSHQANQTINQCLFYKAPELILGLPYSTAVDIWSLGCVMGKMLLNCVLFPGESEYETLCYIVDLLGPPPDHLVNAGRKSAHYFKRTVSNQWVLKTPAEYWGKDQQLTNRKSYKARFWHRARMSHLKFEELAATEERKNCITLIKAMLQWDPEKRITPKDILNHSFIIRNCCNPSSSCHLSITALGQEPNTNKDAGSSTTMAHPTSTNQEKKVFNCVVNLLQERRCTFDIADQPMDSDKNLLQLPQIDQPPCEQLGQPVPTENRFLLRNRDGERPITGPSLKSTIKQEEQSPLADVVPDTTNESYSHTTKDCSKPKQKCFLQNMCLGWVQTRNKH